MRAVLIVNPAATTTTSRMRDVLIHALAASCTLTVHTTDGRGHARSLAAAARREGVGLVMTFGGDGTAHEAVNGLLSPDPDPAPPANPATPATPAPPANPATPADPATPANPPSHPVPTFAPLPGGSANVFSRALGFSADPVEATGQVIEAIETDRSRLIGLGRVSVDAGAVQWFTFTAGVGLDAAVMHAMEGVRQSGRTATPARYVGVALGALARADRRTPHLQVELADGRTITGVYTAIVQNCVPWTFLGRIPLSVCPDAGFTTGLDVCALRSLGIAQTLALGGSLLRGARLGRTDRHVIAHDQDRFVIRAAEPMPAQIDGEPFPAGEVFAFDSAPAALRVLGNGP